MLTARNVTIDDDRDRTARLRAGQTFTKSENGDFHRGMVYFN